MKLFPIKQCSATLAVSLASLALASTSVGAAWPDRELFVHVGHWEAKHPQAKDVAGAKFVNCAVRTQRWRFVNNSQLYGITVDPGETKDVSAEYPQVVSTLRRSYDQWWDETVPLMVNEGVTLKRYQKPTPLGKRYMKQIEIGIPDWSPTSY